MDFKDLLEKRYSCRMISDEKIDESLIKRILDVAIMAPTAVNKQPYKVFVMESDEAKNNIRAVTRHTFGANTFLVVGYKEDEAWTRKYDGRNFGDVDASIAATYIMLEICNLGLETTWVGHFDAEKLKDMCPEMKDYDLIAIFPIGYARDDSKPAGLHYERKSEEEIVVKL